MVNPIANHVRLKTFGWRRCYTLKKLDEKLDEKKMWLHWTEPQYLWQLGEAPPKSCQKVAKCQRHFQPRKYGHFSTGNLVAWHRWWAHHDSAFATFINIMEYQCFMHIQSYTSLRYRCTVFCAFTCVYIYTHHMMCSVFLVSHVVLQWENLFATVPCSVPGAWNLRWLHWKVAMHASQRCCRCCPSIGLRLVISWGQPKRCGKPTMNVDHVPNGKP